MDANGTVLPSLEPEKRAALSFDLDPFDQLPGAHLGGVHLERIAVRQLAPILYRVTERLAEASGAPAFRIAFNFRNPSLLFSSAVWGASFSSD
jgi:hypothetical protein